MTSYTKQDLEDLLTGAILYGSGGGGPAQMGELMKTKILEQRSQPQIAKASDMADDDWAVIVAGVGSPAAAHDFNPSCAVDALEQLEKVMGVSFGYVMAAEIGAGNSFMPIYVAAEMVSKGRNVKALDVAGSDRAVPSITMCTFAAAGVPVNHFMVSNLTDHRGETVDGAAKASDELGAIISKPPFNQVAGVAIWPMQGKTVKKTAIPGTFAKALALGRAWRNAPNIAEKLGVAKDLMKARILGQGKLTAFNSQTKGGFDFGRADVTLPDGHILSVFNKNENLLAWRNDLPHPVTIGPDLISYVYAETGQPFSNAEADSYKGKEIIVLASPASAAMRQDPIVQIFLDAVANIGGYPGPAVPLSQL